MIGVKLAETFLFLYLSNHCPQAGHSHSVEERVAGEMAEVGGQYRERTEDDGQEHRPGRNLSRHKQGKRERNEHYRSAQSHGQEAEVVDDGTGDEGTDYSGGN